MERSTIENRDREVVEKFRAVVDAKEHRKKIARRRFFGGVLVLVCICGFFFFKYFSPAQVSPVRYASNPVAVARSPQALDPQAALSKDGSARDQGRMHQEAPEAFMSTEPAEPVPTSSAGNDGVMPSREKIPKTVALLRPAAGLKSFDKDMAADPTRILKPRPGLDGKSSSASAVQSVPPSPQVRIAEIVTCRGVDRRQPASRQKVFSMGKGENPHVWMDVRSKKTPQTLRHVYYLNDREYCRIPLDIKYAKTRTWSNISLKHPYEAGHWRVEVVTGKGDVISRTEFTVVF